MKNITLIIIVFLFASVKTFSQVIPCYYYEISFEGTGVDENSNCHWLYNDTISNPSNIWQIGPPQKTNLSSAYSNPNVIITDTINTYPINDTSSFILGHIASLGLTITNAITLSGKYYINTDTLTDIGTIEFSPNNGITWIDLFNPLSFSSNIWWGPEPILTGNSNNWKYFWVEVYGLNPSMNIQEGDTVLWRFTFKSDGIETFKDGLMFDSLYVLDAPPVGVNAIDSEENTSVYPNPFNSSVTLSLFRAEGELNIYNVLGKLVYTQKITNAKMEIDLTELNSGVYFIQVKTENGTITKKIVKQ